MDLGPTEILIILVVLLLLFGPSKLAGLGASLGKGIREFKKGLSTDPDPVQPPAPAAPPAPAELAPIATAAPVEPAVAPATEDAAHAPPPVR
jgi:sec-independent protein translocase protein TatA